MKAKTCLHEKVLESDANYLRLVIDDMNRTKIKIKRAEREFAFYSLQIDSAKKLGMRYFDKEKFLSNRRP